MMEELQTAPFRDGCSVSALLRPHKFQQTILESLKTEEKKVWEEINFPLLTQKILFKNLQKNI